MVWINRDDSLKKEEKIEWCIRQGMNFRQIKLICGNPSTKEIKDVIRKIDPKMYGMLGDTESLSRYRDILYNSKREV